MPRNARIDVEDVCHVVATIGPSAVPCIATKERTLVNVRWGQAPTFNEIALRVEQRHRAHGLASRQKTSRHKRRRIGDERDHVVDAELFNNRFHGFAIGALPRARFEVVKLTERIRG